MTFNTITMLNSIGNGKMNLSIERDDRGSSRYWESASNHQHYLCNPSSSDIEHGHSI